MALPIVQPAVRGTARRIASRFIRRQATLLMCLLCANAPALAAQLSHSVVTGPPAQDLSALGTADWAHWGLTGTSSVDRKQAGTGEISALTLTGGGSANRNTAFSVSLNWSDGSPTASVSATKTGLRRFGVGTGFELSVPADTAVRTLHLVLGIKNGTGRLTAELSDSSAAPLSVDLTSASGKAGHLVSIDFSAAGSGATLTLGYELLSLTGSGWAALQSAALENTTGNAAPLQTPIGPQTVVAGDLLSLPVSATDADGPAPLTLSDTTTLPRASSVLTDNGGGSGQISWQSQSGDDSGSPYQIVVSASDGLGASSDETVLVTVLPPGGSGSLAGTSALAPNNVDLTAEGSADWAHWGRVSAASIDRKAGGGARISDQTPTGGGNPSQGTGQKARYSWSDGDPESTVVNTRTGLRLFSLNTGFDVSAPADGTERTLVLFVGVNKVVGTLTATLSDGSAAPYTVDISELSAKRSYRVALTYQAGAPGQQLNVNYSLTQKPAGGWIALESAALTVNGAVNDPPDITPIADHTITEGDLLTLSVSASDADGPAPLTLSETNDLPGAPSVLTDHGGGSGTISWQSQSGDASGSPFLVTVDASDDAGAMASEPFMVTVLPTGGGSGTVSGSAEVANANVDLTAVAGADWAHWAFTSATSVDRRSGGGNQISDVVPINGTVLNRSTNHSTRYSWSDGAPNASATDTRTGLRIYTEDRGFEFTVPADTSQRNVTAYVGVNRAVGELTATLSDGSAAPFSVDITELSAKKSYRVSIDYAAGSAGQTLTIRYMLKLKASATSGWASVESATLSNPVGLTLPYSEDFSSGAPDWTPVDDPGNPPGNWMVNAGTYDQTAFIGFNGSAMNAGYHVGTFSMLSTGTNLTDYRFSTTVTPTATTGQDTGAMLRVNAAATSYVRVSFSGANSFARLELHDNGTVTTLAHSAQGRLPGVPYDLTVDAIGTNVVVHLDGQRLFAAQVPLLSGTVALYCRDACRFDNVLIDPPPTAPAIALVQPTAHSVRSSTAITAQAVIHNAPGGALVDFSVPGQAGACGPASEIAPGLFEASCTLPGIGRYSVQASLLDSQSMLLDTDTRIEVGVGSLANVAGLGDSITAGLDDRTAEDGTSSDGLIVGIQGWEAPLASLLSDPADPFIVFNNGVPGDASDDLAEARLAAAVERHQDADTLLVTIGVNDAGGTLFTPSGLGCSGGGCDGTFAGYLQDVIDAGVAAGKAVVVARTPPRFGDPFQAPHPDPGTHTQNLRIAEYNQVISSQLVNHSVGPDFYDFFLGAENRFYLYQTNLHPNALGYLSMAQLHAQTLGTSTVQPFFATDLCLRLMPAATCETPLLYKQNLIEPGDPLFIDTTGALTNSAPASLSGGRWVQTADADRNLSHADYLSFNLPGSATLFVAYDSAASSLPAWLDAPNFSATGDSLITDHGSGTVFDLYSASYSAGLVTLGGADAASHGAAANYLVVIVP